MKDYLWKFAVWIANYGGERIIIFIGGLVIGVLIFAFAVEVPKNKTIARQQVEIDSLKVKAELYDSLCSKVGQWSKIKQWPLTR